MAKLRYQDKIYNMVNMPKKFLIFSAHPDDLEFHCAGTVAKLVEEGNEVIYCIVSNGAKGMHKLKIPRRKMIQMRKKEQETAAKAVGVKRVIFLNEEDGEIENTLNLRRKIVSLLRKIKPDIVLSPDPADTLFDSFPLYHRDHRMVAEAVFDAIYPASGNEAFFRDLKQKPHNVKEVWFFASARSSLWVDISKTIYKKTEALLSHRSQITNEKETKRKIFIWAKKKGKKKKIKYAEDFRKLSL